MKSPTTIIIVKIVATLLIIGAFYFLFLTSKINQLVKNQSDIEKISLELRNADKKLQQLKEVDKNKKSLEDTKLLVNNYWPEEQEASSFIVNIEQTTTSIPLIVDSLNVAEPKTTKASKTTDTTDKTDKKESKSSAPNNKYLDFTASFSSPYQNILVFFEKMESLSRFNTIESISLGGYNDDEGTLNLRVQGKIYYGR
ncbi:MAG: Pilus assembly protein, PilO [bacterium ADurb.Bin212]|nr:MAG: Pilus assembly protein, PilO [bacterium ADurb.Bin212]